jgi:uncharacterized tellurite resistance protein B-like protein
MENEITPMEYLANCQALLVSSLITADGELTKAELATAANLFAVTFRMSSGESLALIDATLDLLDPLDAKGREELQEEALTTIKENLKVELRHTLYSMLEEIALSDGLDSSEHEWLSLIHSIWELPGEFILSSENNVETDSSTRSTMEVFHELLAGAVDAARLRAIAAGQIASYSEEQRKELENTFWWIIEAIFTLATVDDSGKPIAEDAPVYCAGFGSAFKVKEEQSANPEFESFLNLRFQYAVLFPNEPVPYELEEGMEDFEKPVQDMVEKKRKGLDPEWRTKMLAPIKREGGRGDTRGPIINQPRKSSSAPAKSSGCAIFLLASVGFISSILV